MTKNTESIDFNPKKIPDSLPILPLYDTVLFPKMVLPLVVMQSDSIRLVDDAMSGDRMIGIAVSAKGEEEAGEQAETMKQRLHTIGTSALILKMAKTEDSKAQLLVQGVSRFEIGEYLSETPYLRARVATIEEQEEKDDTEIKALMSNIVGLFSKVVALSPGLPDEIAAMSKTIKEAGVLADMVASVINAELGEKQAILETRDVRQRLKKVSRLVNQQLDILELGNKIQTQVKGDMDKKQREYYLRQQLDAIREELGEKDDTNVEIEEYRAKIEKGNLPEAAEKEALRELTRLSRMHPSSAEYTVSSTYLDWLTVLPWDVGTEDNLDINKAREVLDNDHYGLEKAKKRVIEYLAVRKLKPESKGPILCFAGPPGTGKTSLGRSIANALGREFIRISLGGVRDEAEIRGHRRTYVGALPGRIIQGIRRAESNNPVFMLDEIDKVGSDFRGDPSSALLEVLDPEQNFSFSDHYLDVPFDLSKVMFITTANILDTIPGPLRDRMEVLQLLGYTLDEKVKIAFRYLIPRQREAHGLKARQITFTTGAVRRIIAGYTREAGLRNLEREIASVCRGVAANVAAGKVERVSITVKNLSDFLGPQQITQETGSPHRHSGGGHRAGMDPDRWGDTLYRGHRHARRQGTDTHRAVGRCHEGIRLRRTQLYPRQCEKDRDRGGFLQQDRSSHPHPGRRYPQRRPLCRCNDPHGPDLAAYREDHPQTHGHDR
jgi:ATP-dependent Lon protease